MITTFRIHPEIESYIRKQSKAFWNLADDGIIRVEAVEGGQYLIR